MKLVEKISALQNAFNHCEGNEVIDQLVNEAAEVLRHVITHNARCYYATGSMHVWISFPLGDQRVVCRSYEKGWSPAGIHEALENALGMMGVNVGPYTLDHVIQRCHPFEVAEEKIRSRYSR